MSSDSPQPVKGGRDGTAISKKKLNLGTILSVLTVHHRWANGPIDGPTLL